MNQTELRDKKRLPNAPAAVAALAVLFFMLYTACTEVIFFRYAAAVLAFLLVLFMTRSKLMTVLTGLACLSALLSSMSEGSTVLFIACIAVIGFGGFAVAYANPLLWIGAMLLPLALGMIITGEVFVVLPMLCLALSAVTLGICLHRGLSRTVGAALTAAVLLTSLAAVLLLSLVIENGGIPEGYIETLIQDLRERFVNEFFAVIESNPDDEFYKTVSKVITKDFLRELINAVIRLLPALLVILAELIAYFSGLLAVLLCGNLMPRDTMKREAVEFRVTLPTAIVYLAAFLFSFLFSGFEGRTIGILALSMTTLHLVLLPPLALCGLLRFLFILRTKWHPGPFTFILLAILLFISPMYSIYLLGFFGAISLLLAERKKKKDDTL